MVGMQRVLVLVVVLMSGCGVVDPVVGRHTSQDLLIPNCATLDCDLVNCVTVFARGETTPTCRCGWWDVAASDDVVCEYDGAITPDPS